MGKDAGSDVSGAAAEADPRNMELLALVATLKRPVPVPVANVRLSKTVQMREGRLPIAKERSAAIADLFRERPDLLSRLQAIRQGPGAFSVRLRREFGFRPTHVDCVALASLCPPVAVRGLGKTKGNAEKADQTPDGQPAGLDAKSPRKPSAAEAAAALAGYVRPSPRAPAAVDGVRAPRVRINRVAMEWARQASAEADRLADEEAERQAERPAKAAAHRALLDKALQARRRGPLDLVELLAGSPAYRALLVPAYGEPILLELTDLESKLFNDGEERRKKRRRTKMRPPPV